MAEDTGQAKGSGKAEGCAFKTGAADCKRLTAIEKHTDAFTQGIVGALGLGQDARCLDVGAGGGSVARWFAEHFPSGETTAVDIDVSLLAGCLPVNARVIRDDIARLVFPERHFDLIHARFVLSHLRERDELVGRFVSWLRPGGWLVIAEPYQLDPAEAGHPRVARVLAAYGALVRSKGMDLAWIRRVPAALARAGLGHIQHFSRTTHLGGGASDRWAPLIEPVADQLNEYGVARAELDEFFHALHDPAVIDVPQIIIAVVGQKH